jgi:IstB-like ATP binding protein
MLLVIRDTSLSQGKAPHIATHIRPIARVEIKQGEQLVVSRCANIGAHEYPGQVPAAVVLEIHREKGHLAARYTRGSLLITSNVPFDGWGKLFGDEVLASAILDRPLHQSHIFAINRPSYRLKDKLASRGGPLLEEPLHP